MKPVVTVESLISIWQHNRAVAPEHLCAEHPELLAEVRERMHALTEIERLMGTPAALPQPMSLQESVSRQAEQTVNRPASVIDGYQLLGELGRGGMGVVYKARDSRLGRVVALKQLLAQEPLPELQHRFRAEAEAIARLQHPHIAQVYASGVDGREQPYFVMEYVAGGSLYRAIAGRPQPVKDSARLVLLLARAVHAAHEKGIIHRDLKPANVLLAPPADEPALNSAWGCPRITDFGLAKDLFTGQQGVSVSGMLLGTPAYMAPEQAEGRSADISAATDVWALGVILFELLTGQLPFHGASLFETLNKVVQQPAVPPSRLRPEVPPALDAICLRCLAKGPSDRFATAQDLARALHDFLGQQTLTVAEQPVLAPARQRLSWVLGAVLAVLIVVVGGYGLAFWLPGRPTEPKPTSKTGSVQPQAEPLDLSVQVSLFKRANKQVNLETPGSLPVRPGEKVRLTASVAQPAHLYVLLLTSQGEAIPLFPWNESKVVVKDVDAQVPQLPPAQQISTPTQPGKGWTFDRHAGLETFLVLARHEPIPPGFKFSSLLGAVPREEKAPLRHPNEHALFRLDRKDPRPVFLAGQDRGIEAEAAPIDQPMFDLMTRFQPMFESIQIARMAHAAD